MTCSAIEREFILLIMIDQPLNKENYVEDGV